jgi:hypothetical protein
MTARTPILEEIQYLKSLSQLGQSQRATLVAIFIDPPDMLKFWGKLSYNSRLHEILRWRARGAQPRVCWNACVHMDAETALSSVASAVFPGRRVIRLEKIMF